MKEKSGGVLRENHGHAQATKGGKKKYCANEGKENGELEATLVDGGKLLASWNFEKLSERIPK